MGRGRAPISQTTPTRFPPRPAGDYGSINNGSCSLTAPSYAAVNCSTAAGKTITYNWNDMGSPSDDRDYNDAVFNVTCPSGSGSGSQASASVVLTR